MAWPKLRREADLSTGRSGLAAFATELREEGGLPLNFRARASQLLARDNNGEIRAESDGVIILPLYQGQGSDGFFWGRAVP
jgi:hypothetical protein